MWRALHVCDTEIVCFLDGDTANPDPGHLQGLIGPLLADPSLQLVKGAFDRPLLAGGVALPNEGGRVTELMARPLINLHEPRLAGFAQPLAGEFAGRRTLLESIPVPGRLRSRDRGADRRAPPARPRNPGRVSSRHRQNRHQPLRALGEMAYAVLAAVERRIGGDRSAAGGHYLRPWDDHAVAAVPVTERPPLVTLKPAGAARARAILLARAAPG